MRSITRSTVVLLSVLIALGGASATASVHKQKRRPLLLHPRFHVIGRAETVETDGPFVLLESPIGDGFYASGTLVDERTGTRTRVAYPGCHLDENNIPAFGGPWLALSCHRRGQWDGGWELYDLYTGDWRAVVPDPKITSFDCGDPEYCGVGVWGFGAHWIEWATVPCHYCSATYQFQNIDTGQVRSLPGWRAGGRIIPDLDSPSLARTLCQPLTAPRPGVDVSFYGSFAIVGDDVLERCGSRLKLAVGNNYHDVWANSRAVVWCPGDNGRRLDGLFLPSLRRFVIESPPSTSPGYYGFALSAGKLYVLGEHRRVFVTAAPTQSH